MMPPETAHGVGAGPLSPQNVPAQSTPDALRQKLLVSLSRMADRLNRMAKFEPDMGVPVSLVRGEAELLAKRVMELHEVFSVSPQPPIPPQQQADALIEALGEIANRAANFMDADAAEWMPSIYKIACKALGEKPKLPIPTLEEFRCALSFTPQDGTTEALRLLRKISDLVDAEDVGEPLDDAISYANKAIAALTSGASSPQDNAIPKPDAVAALADEHCAKYLRKAFENHSQKKKTDEEGKATSAGRRYSALQRRIARVDDLPK